MTVQPILLQLLFGEMSPQETAHHLCEACLKIICRYQRYSIDGPAKDAFTAGYNQGIRDALSQQRTALRAYFGQPEETT